jgi:2-polyprenyl-3-methyl-5-hydroxy-6-metoxy-1,4-benzoquinol methylase
MTDENQKQLVALGYDRIADIYLDRFGRSSVRTAKLAELIAHLPVAASILDLGCGAGIPVARDLVERGFKVTGVDRSNSSKMRALAWNESKCSNRTMRKLSFSGSLRGKLEFYT